MPGRDGLLVLASSEGMPRGVALLDTPDIDSVVQAHRDFAHQFLDATDLWLFMTSARRYADAAVWELLQDARDRGASLAVVLSRVPPSSAPQLRAHFDAMLEANGLTGFRRFLVAETVVTDAMLPTEIARPIREWLEEIAVRRGPPGRGAHPDHVRHAGHLQDQDSAARRAGADPAHPPPRAARRGQGLPTTAGSPSSTSPSPTDRC